MEWNLLGYLLLGVVAVLSAVAVYFLRSWDQRADFLVKYDMYVDFASQIVNAAEQMYDLEDGQEKLAWAMNKFTKNFPEVDPGVARVFIEATVHQLNEFEKLLQE